MKKIIGIEIDSMTRAFPFLFLFSRSLHCVAGGAIGRRGLLCSTLPFAYGLLNKRPIVARANACSCTPPILPPCSLQLYIQSFAALTVARANDFLNQPSGLPQLTEVGRSMECANPLSLRFCTGALRRRLRVDKLHLQVLHTQSHPTQNRSDFRLWPSPK